MSPNKHDESGRDDSGPHLLRVAEAAKIAGVGRTKAYEMVSTGEWPSVQLGSMIRVPRRILLAWIRAKEVAAEERAVDLRRRRFAAGTARSISTVPDGGPRASAGTPQATPEDNPPPEQEWE